MREIVRGFLAPLTGAPSESHRGTLDGHDVGRGLFLAVLAFLASTDVGLGPYAASVSGLAAILLQTYFALDQGKPIFEVREDADSKSITFTLPPGCFPPAPPAAQPAPPSTNLRVLHPEGSDR